MRPTTRYTFLLTTLIGLIVCPATLFAQQSADTRIITFDVPDAGNTPGSVGCANGFFTGCYGTTPMANNNFGVIVGMYITNNGVYYGFLRFPDGRVIKFSEPNADTTPGDLNGTYPISLNSWGAVAGLYQKTDEVFHGFIREPNGSYIEVDAPDAGTAAFQGTYAVNINDRGEVAGFYLDSSNNSHGFIRSPQGEFTTVDDPNATAGTMIALEQGLNSRGAVAGWYNTASTSYGFIREPDGNFITVAPLSTPLSLVAGINCAGDVAGSLLNAEGNVAGFLLKADGSTATFSVAGPDGAQAINVYNLNNSDEVSGIAIDANFAFHGFIRFPNSDIKTFDAPHAGTGNFQGTRPTTINDSGQVIGWVLDSNNVAHGFIYCPK